MAWHIIKNKWSLKNPNFPFKNKPKRKPFFGTKKQSSQLLKWEKELKFIFGIDTHSYLHYTHIKCW